MDEPEYLDSEKLALICQTHCKSSCSLPDDEDDDKDLKLHPSNVQKILLGFVACVAIVVIFTLEVLGAIGAIWGSMELFTLRTKNNTFLFQIVASSIGFLALIRFVFIHVVSFNKYAEYPKALAKTGWLGKIIKAFETPYPALKTAFDGAISLMRKS